MRLKEHKAETGIPFNFYAKKLGIPPRRLSAYVNGETPIPLRYARAIRDLTEGRVSIDDWPEPGEGAC